MNTTATTAAAAAETTETTESTVRATRPTRRLRSLLMAALLAVGITAGLNVTDAAPASAATTVTACFRWTNGAAYANYPVYLYTYNASTGRYVTQVRSGKTGANGCGTFYNTNSSQRLVVVAYLPSGRYAFQGLSPNYANPGNGGANLGTGYVYTYQLY